MRANAKYLLSYNFLSDSNNGLFSKLDVVVYLTIHTVIPSFNYLINSSFSLYKQNV